MAEIRSRRNRARSPDDHQSTGSSSNASSTPSSPLTDQEANETTPLLTQPLQQTDPHRESTTTQTHWSTISIFSSLIWIYLISLVCWASMLSSWGFAQNALGSTDSLVNSGERASGMRAWSIVETIAKESHPYNSQKNDLVHDFLRSTLFHVQKTLKERIEQGSCDASPVLEIAPLDTINVTVGYPGHKIYYEGTNIVARLVGKSKDAILVSSHYDSVAMAPGVTDDGIAVGSMISALESLIHFLCHRKDDRDGVSQLEYSVIFLWNNAEEIALLGADAFVLHPWFRDVKAFINLEGSGAAVKERPTLFRANSFDLISAFIQGAPFPHMSVTTNQVMRVIPSDTDYRPYVSVGGLPGIDVAFTTFRYHYHTATDDLAHASPMAAQHMSDNVLGFVKRLATTQKSLENFNRSRMLPNPVQDVLPIPDFYFHDVMGWKGILISKVSWISAHFILLVISFGFFIARGVWAYVFRTSSVQNTRVKRNGASIYDWIKGATLIWGFFFGTVVVCLLAAWIKHKVSPASTYGLVELNFAWYILAILLMMSVCANIAFGSHTELSFDQDLNIVNCSLWVFWITWGLVSLGLSYLDLNLLYFLFYPVIFSAIALIFQQALRSIASRYANTSSFQTYQSRWAPFIVPFISLPPSLILTMDLYRQFFTNLPSLISDGLPSFALDALICFLFIFPFVNMLPIFTTARSKSSITWILLFLFFIPYILSMILFSFGPERPLKIRYVETVDAESGNRATASIQVANGIPGNVFLASLNLPKEWQPISCKNQMCTLEGLYRPDQFDKYGLNSSSLIDAEFSVEKKNLDGLPDRDESDLGRGKEDGFVVHVSAFGSPGSRACFVEITHEATNVMSHIVLDPADPHHWKDLLTGGLRDDNEDNQSVKESSQLSCWNTTRIDVLRRHFGPHPHRRIHIPIDIHLTFQDPNSAINLSYVNVSISCAHHDDVSPNAAIFYKSLPDYTVLANLVNKNARSRLMSNRDRHGHFIAERSFHIPLISSSL